MRIWRKSCLGSKINFIKKEKEKKKNKIFCKTILLAVRRQSVNIFWFVDATNWWMPLCSRTPSPCLNPGLLLTKFCCDHSEIWVAF